MTRINGNIPIAKLSDQLLLNELGEIGRILYNVEKRIEKERKFDDIPSTFRLGTGHMTFFYDKCLFIYFRYLNLRREYCFRFGQKYSMAHDCEMYNRALRIEFGNPDLYNDWQANDEDNNLVLERIYERSKKYKTKHTYRGVIINDWFKFLFKED